MIFKLIFPFYHLLHVFSLPLLVVLVGFKKDTSLAADLSIIYSVIFVCFFPLNGNVRHYLLNSNDSELTNNLVLFRFFSYIPIFIITTIICKIFLNVEFLNLLLIIYIGSLYWLNEIFISKQEKENNYILIILFLFIYFFIFIFFLLSDFGSTDKILILSIIFFINILVFFIIIKNLRFNFDYSNFKQSIKKQIIPQIGGTFILGISSFLFKLIVLFFLNKDVSGTIFIAFTLSGILLTIFTYGLGPTLFLNKEHHQSIKIIFGFLTLLMFFLGITLITLQFNNIIVYKFIDNQEIFIFCFGFCLLGLPLSIIGQYYKLKVIHQNLELKIFKFDMIPNFSILILLTLCLFFLKPYFIGLTYVYTGFLTMLIYKKLLENK